VMVSWMIIIGVLIPLNFLAVELNNNNNYEVVDSNGNALAMRQSVGVASTFTCTHDYIAQLQYIFITDLHKEQVLSVQIIPRNAEDPTASPFTEIAMLNTASGIYQIPCTTTTPTSAKRDDHKDDDNKNHGAVKWHTSKHCGDGHLDDDEECDHADHCEDNCLCVLGHTPDHGNRCKSLCGNNVIDLPEECDGDDGCEEHCKCGKGFTAITTASAPIVTGNGTNSTHNGTGTRGCAPINPCTFHDSPCEDHQTCAWDGVTGNGGVTCTCLSGFTALKTRRGDLFCLDVDECSSGTNPCSPPQNCHNIPGTYYCH